MRLAAIFVVASCALGCGGGNSSNGADSSADYSALAKLDVKAQVALVNEWHDTKPGVTSFVTSQELDVKFPDGRELKSPLPANEMYIAFAPYMTRTHACSTHYPSNCQGELANATFHVTAKDDAGALLFEGDVTSLANGFFELWLPRGETFTVHITQGALSADEVIHTNADSPTCVTTAKLK